MSEMVERVARTFCPEPGDCGLQPCGPCGERARAAIAAMRTPTEDMEDEGANRLWHDGKHHDPACEDTVLIVYRAMIDAALK